MCVCVGVWVYNFHVAYVCVPKSENSSLHPFWGGFIPYVEDYLACVHFENITFHLDYY